MPPSLRFVELDGCFNVRDLGGYPTADGRVVRRGQTYRANAPPHRRRPRRLAALGIVIDLRTAAEVTHRSWQPEAPVARAVAAHPAAGRDPELRRAHRH